MNSDIHELTSLISVSINDESCLDIDIIVSVVGMENINYFP